MTFQTKLSNEHEIGIVWFIVIEVLVLVEAFSLKCHSIFLIFISAYEFVYTQMIFGAYTLFFVFFYLWFGTHYALTWYMAKKYRKCLKNSSANKNFERYYRTLSNEIGPLKCDTLLLLLLLCSTHRVKAQLFFRFLATLYFVKCILNALCIMWFILMTHLIVFYDYSKRQCACKTTMHTARCIFSIFPIQPI